MNPFGARARAQELSDVLDGVLRGGLPGPGGTAAAPYARLAVRLQELGGCAAVTPRAEFRDALRTRLMAVAAVQAYNAGSAAATTATTATPARAAGSVLSGRRAGRGVGAAVGAMASVVAVAGVAVAGSKSLPGDPFYGVKKGTEALELTTTRGAVDRGSKHLDFARERLAEVRALSLGRDAALGPVGGTGAASAGLFGGSTAARVRQTLAAMDDETRQGSRLLTDAYRDQQSAVPLQILVRFAGRQSADLRTLLPDLPAAARARAEASLTYVSGVAAQTSELLAVGVCTGDCNPVNAAPTLPPADGQPAPAPAPSASRAVPCGCAPAAAPTADPTGSPSPVPTPQPSSSTSPAPSPQPSPPASPSPSPSPSRSAAPLPPLPVPTPPLPSPPVPLPTLPAPLPTLPAPLPTGQPLAQAPLLLPTALTGALRLTDPAPALDALAVFAAAPGLEIEPAPAPAPAARPAGLRAQ